MANATHARIVGKLLRAIQLSLVVIACTASSGLSANWSLFIDAEEGIQFLAIGTPEKRRLDGPEAVKIIWHFEYLEDGTNGYVEATRLKQASFADLDVVRDAADLQLGLEQSGKTKVARQRRVTVAGVSAIEFSTTSRTSKGATWHGVTRMFVVGNTLFTIGVTASTVARLEEQPIQVFLNSFKRLR